jgi:hypothetical protein
MYTLEREAREILRDQTGFGYNVGNYKDNAKSTKMGSTAKDLTNK